MKRELMELQDYHGWTEDKAWVVGDDNFAIVEFNDGKTMTFGSYYDATDWLYERGYR